MKKMHTLRSTSFIACLLAVIMMLGVCTAAVAEPVKGGEMVFPTADVLGEFFTPYKQGSLNAYGWPCYEPLAKRVNLPTGEQVFRPALAESWERDNENNSLTVHLVQNACFSDGTPFTAADVVFTLGVRNEYGTASTIGSPVSVEATDDYTVVITWENFSLNYENWVLTQQMFCKKAFDEKGLDWMLNNMIGTGPYKLVEFIPDVSLTYARNENYWGEVVGPDTIKYLYIADATAQLAAFLSGEVDRMTVSDPVVADQLTAAGFSPMPMVGGGAEAQYLAIPLSIDENDPLYNTAVRKAIFEHGIDWQTLAIGLGGSVGYHTDAIGMTAMTYYDASLEQSSFDLELAKQELADAGYADGFTTTIYTSAPFAAAATVLQDFLSKLNITAECEFVDYSLVQSDYIGAKATQNGICITALFFPDTPQSDRFVKHLNPHATYGASSTWSEEIYPLWEVVPTAQSQAEEDAALCAYVNSYVHGGSNIWPMYNTTTLSFCQEWAGFSDVSLANGTMDPLEIWTTR